MYIVNKKPIIINAATIKLALTKSFFAFLYKIFLLKSISYILTPSKGYAGNMLKKSNPRFIHMLLSTFNPYSLFKNINTIAETKLNRGPETYKISFLFSDKSSISSISVPAPVI